MKITIKSKNISKIQEQKNLPKIDDKTKAEIIRIFTNDRDVNDPYVLKKNLENLGIKPATIAIYYLNRDIMAAEAYTNAVESHNDMVKIFGGEEVHQDAFPRFPDTRMKADNNNIPDPRSYQKNLKGGISENNMKITKDYLKQIIQEEIKKMSEEENEDEKEEPGEWEKYNPESEDPNWKPEKRKIYKNRRKLDPSKKKKK